MNKKRISKTLMGAYLIYTVLCLVMAGCSKHPQESTPTSKSSEKEVTKEQDTKDERKGHERSEGDGSGDGGRGNGEISGESSVEASNNGEGNGEDNNDEGDKGGDGGEGDRRSDDNGDDRASGDEGGDGGESSMGTQVPAAQYLDRRSTLLVASLTGSRNDEVLDRDEEPKVQEAESGIDKELNGDSKVGPHQEILTSSQREIVRNRRKNPVPLKADKRLASTHMRGFIESQFMTFLKGFKESEDTFSRGGIVKHTFFFREDDTSGDRTYIALANDYPEDGQSIKYVGSGEQSISIVLSAIKNDLEKAQDNGSNTQILIPLQQITKEHWVLLEIVLRSDNKPTSNTDMITAQCYDSKGKVSGSYWHDSLLGSNRRRIDYVNACVKEQFDVNTEWIYEGTQAHRDDHNCGRHTLIKMGALLRLKNALGSIEGINKILTSGGEEQSPDPRRQEDNVETQEGLAVSSVTSWEELSN